MISGVIRSVETYEDGFGNGTMGGGCLRGDITFPDLAETGFSFDSCWGDVGYDVIYRDSLSLGPGYLTLIRARDYLQLRDFLHAALWGLDDDAGDLDHDRKVALNQAFTLDPTLDAPGQPVFKLALPTEEEDA